MRTKSLQAWRVTPGQCTRTEELLAAEAALHVRLNGIAYSTTVRTPGDDIALVRGLLFSEGVIPNLAAAMEYREIADPETGEVGCVEVIAMPQDIAKEIEHRRSAMGSASCGLCGLREAEEVLPEEPVLPLDCDAMLTLESLRAMRARMESVQAVFSETGGCHGAAAFDSNETLLATFEDVGRHNAVDKVIGALILDGRLDAAQLLLVSGRISYELVFKAFRARIPIIAGVSAPSSMAVEMAERFGITVLGFCRDDRATVYTHPQRTLPRDAVTG